MSALVVQDAKDVAIQMPVSEEKSSLETSGNLNGRNVKRISDSSIDSSISIPVVTENQSEKPVSKAEESQNRY